MQKIKNRNPSLWSIQLFSTFVPVAVLTLQSQDCSHMSGILSHALAWSSGKPAMAADRRRLTSDCACSSSCGHRCRAHFRNLSSENWSPWSETGYSMDNWQNCLKAFGKNQQAKSPRAVCALPEQTFCSVHHSASSCLHWHSKSGLWWTTWFQSINFCMQTFGFGSSSLKLLGKHHRPICKSANFRCVAYPRS